MDKYDWKSHYAVLFTKHENIGEFCHYRIEEENGKGEVISCSVFPGIQAIYNDLYISKCGRTVPKSENIIEINYCVEGRYECEVSNQYCFYACPGDLSIGNVGRREAAGSFPTGHFSGLTLFIDLESAWNNNEHILRDIGADLDLIRDMALKEPRRFYIRGKEKIDDVCRQMVSAVTNQSLPLLKLKTLELLVLISDQELLCRNDLPVYLSQKNAQLAKDVRERITNDLSCHVTLRQLSEELHTSPTAIKSAFKSVYGESIREHMKALRLQEAQRLLHETDRPIAEVAEMVVSLREQRRKMIEADVNRRTDQTRMDLLIESLNQLPASLTEYDDKIVRKMVERVVVSYDGYEITLKNGLSKFVEK